MARLANRLRLPIVLGTNLEVYIALNNVGEDGDVSSDGVGVAALVSLVQHGDYSLVWLSIAVGPPRKDVNRGDTSDVSQSLEEKTAALRALSYMYPPSKHE